LQNHLKSSNNDRITWDVLQEVLLLLRDTGQRLEPVAAVCRRWREVYTSIPAIWTTMRLFPSKSLGLIENLLRLSTLASRTAECLVAVDCRETGVWQAD
ncbi:F-box-like domain-containing protein, partial [Lysobacter sp. 13A]|nr:F-box-like domain-containing protein [Lysobacter selenitireducens]